MVLSSSSCTTERAVVQRVLANRHIVNACTPGISLLLQHHGGDTAQVMKYQADVGLSVPSQTSAKNSVAQSVLTT